MRKKYTRQINDIEVEIIATDNPSDARQAADKGSVVVWIEYDGGQATDIDFHPALILQAPVPASCKKTNEHHDSNLNECPDEYLNECPDEYLEECLDEYLDECLPDTLLTSLARRHLNLPLIIAETDRLIIRELSMDDLPNIHESIRPDTEHARTYIESMYKLWGFGIWLVILKDQRNEATHSHKYHSNHESHDTIIGKAGLGTRDECSFPDLGYEIIPKYRRQGYAKEASLSVIDFAKSVLELSKLSLVCDKENAASLSLAASLGFYSVSAPDGALPGHVYLEREL